MEALGIDAKLLLAQAINFIVLFFIFKRFISKPFLEFLAREKKKEQEKEKILSEVAEREAKLTLREQEIFKEAQDQAAKILQEAKKTALKMREELVKRANEEAEGIRTKAHEQIGEERKKLYDEVRSHIIATSASLTKRVIKEFVTEEKQEEIFNKLVSTLDKKDMYEN